MRLERAKSGRGNEKITETDGKREERLIAAGGGQTLEEQKEVRSRG